MEGSKKFEDAALRGIARHHVWKSRTSDLTVVNLRDPGELLSTREATPTPAVAAAAVAPPEAVTPTPATTAVPTPAAAAAVADVKRLVGQPPLPLPPQPRPTTGKLESLNALLSKLQLSRPAAETLAQPRQPQPPVTPPATHPSTEAAAAGVAASVASPPPPSQPPLTVQAASVVPPLPPALSLPVRVAESHNPTFPDLRESSAATGQFEFITGTNIPGQGIVKKAETMSNEASSMALFHDPLWGGGTLMDAFSATPPPVKKSPKSQPRASLAELYGTAAPVTMTTTTTNTATVNFFNATPPTAVHAPMASPPVPAMTATAPLPTPMAPQPMPMMGGLGGMMSAPAPHLATSYPMYTMPLQYVAQPQFPGGVVYNSPAFFPYGTTAMMMPQPQHVPQGYPVNPAAVMRPGTNVKAMPFVPGSTM